MVNIFCPKNSTTLSATFLSDGTIMLPGVITEDGEEGQRASLNLVQSAWTELRFRKGITDIEMQFVPIRKRTEITMDILIEGMTTVSEMILKGKCCSVRQI